MSKLYLNRTLLGNIALVVIFTFLATITLGMVGPGTADAAPVKGTIAESDRHVSLTGDHVAIKDKDGAWKTTGTISNPVKLTTTDNNTAVNFNIQVLTDQNFDLVFAEIYNMLRVYGADIPGVVYDTVYGTAYNVYQFAYKWVYTPGWQVSGTNNYTFLAGFGSTSYVSFILDLEEPPPSTSTTPPATKTEKTDTGDVNYDDNKAIFVPDLPKIDNLLTDSKVSKIELVIPNTVTKAQNTIQVAADTLAKILDIKPVEVKVAGVNLELPTKSIDLSSLKSQGLTLDINITKVSADDKSAAPQPGDSVYKMAGETVILNIRAKDKDGNDRGAVNTFSRPVTLSLNYDPAKLAGADPKFLGIYKLVNGKWRYVGGKIDRTNNKVSTTRRNLSTYTVMAYEKDFADMANHWAKDDVKLMAARQVAGGNTDATFAPDLKVTRAQFAAFLLRALILDEQSATGKRFKDVSAKAWYAGIVEAAADNGLIKGYANGTFKPNALVTREEMAVMIDRALSSMGKSKTLTESEIKAQLSKVSDKCKIASWSRTAMAAAIKDGIIKGRPNGSCLPKTSATRAESVVMIKRFLSTAGEL